ncbi:double-strand break repair protein MRE11 [Anoplophora glabripennis]|nr:double-strand break repair protein MRE11 [Anoplophora glabripennis]
MSITSEENNVPEMRKDDDIFNILVATDIHLGFEEKDPIRDQDTFDTLEEILQIADAEQVDFILLGGDLFHHAQPSPYCIYRCTELLKKYCLGDRPVEIEFLSDPTHNFSTLQNPTVNYEDPNLNISIPVFSIHGNHDDPTGQRQISAMDLLATTGLLNYFGRWSNHEMVEIEPILLKKGQTKLALYGLSHIKDERLGRLFLDKKVKMLAPDDDKDWFNLLVWHQNRATRGVKNFIPDDTLPKFLDLVIWGHEHDCRIEPEMKTNGVYISQPGSSVATSLAAGEAIPKKIGILKIHKKSFIMTPIELKTVRPYIFDEVVLKELNEMDTEDNGLTYSETTVELVKNKINNMIQEAKQLGRTQKVTQKPLIRLNVKYRDERQLFNTIRFGQTYVGQVANPEDMVKCQPIKNPVRQNKSDVYDMPDIIADRVEDIVLKHFNDNDSLLCFSVYPLNEAVKKCIDSNDPEATALISDHFIKETIEKLEESMPEIEELDKFIDDLKRSRQQDSASFVHKILNDPNRVKQRYSSSELDLDDEDNNDSNIVKIDDDDVVSGTSSKPHSGPGSRGRWGSNTSRGSSAVRATRGTRRGRGRAK